jgi:hypothetical protein
VQLILTVKHVQAVDNVLMPVQGQFRFSIPGIKRQLSVISVMGILRVQKFATMQGLMHFELFWSPLGGMAAIRESSLPKLLKHLQPMSPLTFMAKKPRS